MPDPALVRSVFSVAAYAVSFLTGYLLLGRCLGRPHDESGRWLKIFLSPGLGLGFTTAVLFFGLYFFGGLRAVSVIFVWGVHILVLAVLLARSFRGVHPRQERRLSVLKIPFTLLLVLGALLMTARFLKSPYGTGLDVWAMWKLKARFLYYDPEVWQHLFSPVLGFSCRDYPLFYPLALVWGWLAAQDETLVSSWLIAFVFTLSIVGLAMAAVARKGGAPAMLVGLFLISTPHFIGMGSSQYSDILLSYFSLGAVLLINDAFSRKSLRTALTGGCYLGIGCFVKNEGILFLAVVLISLAASAVFCGSALRRERLRYWAAILAGVLPFFMVVGLFKARVGLPNDKMSWAYFQQAVHSGQLVEKSLAILRFVPQELIRENAWVYAWPLFLIIFIFHAREFFRTERLWILTALLLLQGGYFCAYLISPLEVMMNLRTSLDRLLIHSFPVWTTLCFSSLVLPFGYDKVIPSSKKIPEVA